MDAGTSFGFISMLPPIIAVLLAFLTKDTIFSLGLACIVGIFLSGKGFFGFTDLMVRALGNGDFAWIFILELSIGVLIAFFQRTGSIQSFCKIVDNKKFSRAKIQVLTWVMGMFVFFSDYFSALFVGSTMRGLTDKAKISREKLAYICDSTSAPVCTIIPFTGFSVFIAGLLAGIGSISSAEQGFNTFIRAIPYNFYSILTVVFVGLIASGVVKDFGPMGKAEKRALEEGKVLRDGAQPLLAEELDNIEPYYKDKVLNFFLNFVLPVAIVIGIAIGTYIAFNSAKTMEAFLVAAIIEGILMRIQGIPLKDIADTSMKGIKGVMPAVIILAFAYSINTLSKDLGTANYIISATRSWMKPSLLPLIGFLIGGVISFATGTSFGTLGILIPIMVPLAVELSGGAINPIVLATIGGITSGGIFGDHCSPLSDTTILASTGSACDHIDHVKTQMPYALLMAAISGVMYLILGFVFM